MVLSNAAVIPIFFLVTVKLKYLTVSLSPAAVSGSPLNISPSAAKLGAREGMRIGRTITYGYRP